MMQSVQKRKKILAGGFTLIELLVSISILSLAIVATFSAISNNLRSSNFSEDQVTAYYLADEGIEFIKNARDQNGIENTRVYGGGGATGSWLTGIASSSSDPCWTGKVCVIDSPHPSPAVAITACSGNASTCPYLRKDTVSGLYGYTSTWSLTQFQRTITVTVNSPTEAVVTSTVYWKTNGVSKSYVLTEVLESWQ